MTHQPHKSEDGTLKPVASNQWSCDKPDEWTAAIDAAHPLHTKNFDAYDKAMAMVGNRKSKSALVDLVCWLLQRAGPVGVGAAQDATWHPMFDCCSVKQEELVRQFCAEIAGPRGTPASPPDPVRLLEMAQALYEAERESAARPAPKEHP